MFRYCRSILLLSFLLFSSSESHAQFEGKVLPSFADDTQDFGTVKASIRPDGVRMVVGAPTDASQFFPGTKYGAAYVFHFEDGAWQEKARLAPDEPTSFFANALDISDDWVFVGHHYDHSDHTSGGSVRAYRFIGSEWVHHSTIKPSDHDQDFLYGVSLDVSGEQAVIGTLGGLNDDTGLNTGATYILELVNGSWQESAKLFTDIEGEYWFGQNVALEGQILMVSAVSVVDNASNWNVVYFFEKIGGVWVPKGRFYPENHFSNYGAALAIDGAWAAVGDNLGNGKVHVYRNINGAWQEHSILKAPDDSTAFNAFGSSVSIDSTRIVVGTPNWVDTQNGTGGGGIVFEYRYDETEDKWLPDLEWRENGLIGPDQYGSSVYLENDVLFVGAHGQKSDAGGEGAVYVYGDTPPVISSNEREFPDLGLTLSVYPNPIREQTTLEITSKRGGDLQIKAYDMLGRDMGIQYDLYLRPGETVEQSIASYNWPAGSYLLSTEIANRRINQMIVKN